ncbi:hypothetical protein TWF481_006731 [Arthrobotrys musiformis]|uniref:Uncharacterized protein n=1 Tax=Arthrobotrys musiformis TaxID=47236 RepID=A0AAV9W9H2_9PEZI
MDSSGGYGSDSELKTLSESTSFKFEFTLTTTLGDELNAFVWYSRLGLFNVARNIYYQTLEKHHDVFGTVAEFAEMLVESGSYRELREFLTEKLEYPDLLQEEKELLVLLNSFAEIHTTGKAESALKQALSWIESLRDGITTYLRIVTIVSSNLGQLESDKKQPPWIRRTPKAAPAPWSGFVAFCSMLSTDPLDSWNAYTIFRSLLLVLPKGRAKGLYEQLMGEISNQDDEQKVVAAYLIKICYARYLIDKAEYDQARIIINSADPLDGEIRNINDDDEAITKLTIRPRLERKLAILKLKSLTLGATDFYALFARKTSTIGSRKPDPGDHPICKAARENGDLFLEADFLRVSYTGTVGVQMYRYPERQPYTLQYDKMGDLIGYSECMADKITTIAYLDKEVDLQSAPPWVRTRIFSRILYRAIDSAPEPIGTKTFKDVISALDLPLPRFKAAMAICAIQGPDSSSEISGLLEHPGQIFHWLAENYRFKPMPPIQWLTSEELDFRNENNEPPLFVAVNNKNIEMVEYFSTISPKYLVTGEEGAKLLRCAIQNEYGEILFKLLEKVDGLDKKDREQLRRQAKNLGEGLKKPLIEFLDKLKGESES